MTETNFSKKRPSDVVRYFKVFSRYIGTKKLAFVFVLSLMASLSEGVGLVMILPLLAGFDGNSTSSVSEVERSFVVEFFDEFSFAQNVPYTLAMIAGFFVLKGLFLFSAEVYKVNLKTELNKRLKARLFNGYSKMQFEYYSSKDSGHFLNVITGQTSKFIGSSQILMSLGALTISGLVYVSIAVILSWQFGISALAFGMIFFWMFKKLGSRVRAISVSQANEASNLNKLLIQALHAHKYLASTNQYSAVGTKVLHSVDNMAEHERRIGMLLSFLTKVREPLAVLIVLGILIAQIAVFNQPLAPILVSVLLFYRSLNVLMGIQSQWSSFLSASGSIDIVTSQFADLENNVERDQQCAVSLSVGGIEFRDVSFRYNSTDHDVITNLCLEIKANSSVAFVGKSGAGKTTIADLITLLLTPSSGAIYIDGIDSLKINKDDWRRSIGYVSQDPPLFDDTVLNNITMGCVSSKNNDQADLLSRVKEVATQACIDEFIDSLPETYQTHVGERGMRLSGGQRQRLVLARELFRRPTLLILDEATSALDSESEFLIQKTINNLKGDVTVVMIAHRLSTIKNADRIFVMSRGLLVEQGSFSHLSENPDTAFSKLVALQKL